MLINFIVIFITIINKMVKAIIKNFINFSVITIIMLLNIFIKVNFEVAKRVLIIVIAIIIFNK